MEHVNLKLKIIFLFLFLFLNGRTQTYFNNVYDNIYDGQSAYNGFNSSITIEGNIFVYGESFHPNLPMTLAAGLLNAEGNTIWERNFEFKQVKRGTGVVPYYGLMINDSVIVINIYAHDSTEMGTDIFLQAVSITGDSLWFQNLDAGFNDRATKMLLDDDGGILILGFYYLGDSDSSRIIIIKTDSLGNRLWQREYGQPESYNFAYEWSRTADGGFIIAGERNDNNNQNTNFLLMKLDSSFNEEWSKSYDAGFLEFLGGLSSLVYTDNGYFIVGQQEYFAFSTGTNRTKGYIVKTDKNGIELWSKLIGYQYRDIGFRGIVQSGINEYMLLGVIAEDTGWNGKARALLAKMDTSGNIFWQREYNYYLGSDSDHVYPSVIQKMENGDYIISGWVLYPYFNPRYNDAWLMKTDSCGYTEGDVSVAQIQLDTVIDKTVHLRNVSPEYCSGQWLFGDGDSSGVRNPTHTYIDTGSYTISLITRAGNDWDTASLQIHVGDTSTVHSPQTTVVKAQMSLYPNPASTFIILSGYIPEDITGARAEFYDMQGRLVKAERLQNGLVNQGVSTRGLSQGVYAYRVYGSEANIATGRIFIEP